MIILCHTIFLIIFFIGFNIFTALLNFMITEVDISFLDYAVNLAKQGVNNDKGGPFGCIIVRNGIIIGEGYNRVTSTNDPTAHAEVVAIREACKYLGTYQLTACDMYTSCEPCPMCLRAIYWARPERVLYAATRYAAADTGFEDNFIYHQIHLELSKRSIPFYYYYDEKYLAPFQLWRNKKNKKLY